MKRVTLKDVAQDAGVSLTIASFAMNNVKGRVSDELRKKVLKSAKKMGYVPDAFGRNLKTRKSDTIAIVYDESYLEERNASTLQFVAGAVKYARKKGKDILIKLMDIHNLESLMNEYLELYISGKVEGLIFYCRLIDEAHYHDLLLRGVNFVVIPNETHAGNYKAVYMDNQLAMKKAIQFIHHKGYPKIYYLTMKFEQTNQRELGYLETIHELGIEGKVLYYESQYTGKSRLWDAVKDVVEANIERIAIACWNDVDAMNLIDILHAQNLAIPERVGVMGFDDIPGSENTYPALTTIKQPFEEMAKVAIDMILDNTMEPRMSKVDFELIERHSV